MAEASQKVVSFSFKRIKYEVEGLRKFCALISANKLLSVRGVKRAPHWAFLFSSYLFLHLCSFAHKISTRWLQITFKSGVPVLLASYFRGIQLLAFEATSLRTCRHWKLGLLKTSVGGGGGM